MVNQALIFMVVLVIILLIFIISNIRKKDNQGKRKVIKLIKYITISVLSTFFIINIFNIGVIHVEPIELSEYEAEEYFEEEENSIYNNNTQSYIDEIVGYLEVINYLEVHPELKKLDNGTHDEVYEKITTYAYDNGISISEVSKKIQNDDVDAIKKLYDSTKFSKEEFINILELVRIEEEHYGIRFYDQNIENYRAILSEGNYDISEEIKKIENKDFDTISRYSEDDVRLIAAKYPYATEIINNILFEYSGKIIDLIYSIIIGIFIGTAFYAYTETKKIWLLATITIVETVLIYFIEFQFGILQDAGCLNVRLGNSNFYLSGSYNGPLNATTMIATITICMLVVKAIINKLYVNKINKLIK